VNQEAKRWEEGIDSHASSQSPSETFVHVFYAQYLKILRTVVERDTLMSSFGINGDRCFVLQSSLMITLLHTDKYFEKL